MVEKRNEKEGDESDSSMEASNEEGDNMKR